MKYHSCHAIACNRNIDPSLLMCKHHWGLVPTELKQEVWTHYRKGQEKDKKPSENYLRAQMMAVNHVAKLEGRESMDIEKRINFLKKHGAIN